MRRWLPLIFSFGIAGLASAPVCSADGVEYEARWAEIRVDATAPDDLLYPEGKTRWDLAGVATGRTWVRTLSTVEGADSWVRADRHDAVLAAETSTFLSSASGHDAERWVLPQRYLASAEDATRSMSLERLDGSAARGDRLRVEARIVGQGWLHLPSGPRQVVLQRALILREPAPGRGLRPERLVHRWIDPRAGVVAEVSGPPSSDGTRRTLIERASVVEQVLQGAGSFKIYVQNHEAPIFSRINYGYDRGENTAVSSLDPAAGHVTINDLKTASAWDFSGNDLTTFPGMSILASTVTPVCESPGVCETCSAEKCGFTAPGLRLSREDKNFGDPFTVTAIGREDRAADVTFWMRAAVRNEGETTGGLGENESRLCYDEGRTEVPLFRFQNQDAGGWFMQVGDTWRSDSDPGTPGNQAFACEQSIFNHVCPNSCGAFCTLYIGQCEDHTGTQGATVLGEGPVTLPSGHTFQALLLENVADFCVWLSSGCSPGFDLDQVRTVSHLWEVPWLGTVTRIMSAVEAPNTTSYTTVMETDIKYGLFPPVSISAGSVTDSSVALSWNPGSITDQIDGYRVYWDTDPGAATPYANSVTLPGAATTSTTVTGLAPATEYFFTVTALSDFTDPSTGTARTYESLLPPSTVSGGAQSLPLEVSATTACGAGAPATQEVAGVTVGRSGGDIEICWSLGSDACRDGFRILGALDPSSDSNFSVVVPDTGLTTCHTFNPAESNFIVVGKGPGGTGPWGHFGL